jgi:predicted transcriptional regulator
MKDEDVRIGMKVTVQGVEDVCIVVYEKDYKTKNGNVYTLQNEKTGKKMTLNACDFEPYIKMTEKEKKLHKQIEELSTENIMLRKHIQSLIDFIEESKEEKLEKEIREAFAEYIKNGCSWSLQTCFRDGFLAGRESK